MKEEFSPAPLKEGEDTIYIHLLLLYNILLDRV